MSRPRTRTRKPKSANSSPDSMQSSNNLADLPLGLMDTNETMNTDPDLNTSQERDIPTSATLGARKGSIKYKKLEEDLNALVGSIAMATFMFNQPDGQVLLEHTPTLSNRLTNVARQNEGVYKTLKTILEGSVYTALVAEVGAIGAAILSNHGVSFLSLFVKGQPDAELEKVAA
jgi:hypothetical protein